MFSTPSRESLIGLWIELERVPRAGFGSASRFRSRGVPALHRCAPSHAAVSAWTLDSNVDSSNITHLFWTDEESGARSRACCAGHCRAVPFHGLSADALAGCNQ